MSERLGGGEILRDGAQGGMAGFKIPGAMPPHEVDSRVDRATVQELLATAHDLTRPISAGKSGTNNGHTHTNNPVTEGTDSHYNDGDSD